MKKIIAFILILILVAGLYGCCINTTISPKLGDDDRIPAAEETKKNEPVHGEENPAAALLRDTQLYHTYLTTGGLQNALGYIEEGYARVETCLVDLNGDGVYEMLLKLTDTQYLSVRGYASVSVLFGIESSQVVELTKAEYTGGSMGGYYLHLLYDTQMEKYVIVNSGVDRLNMLEYSGRFEAYSYANNTITPYFTAYSVSYSVSSGYYDEYIAAVENETTLYYENGDQFYYYQVDDHYVSEEDYIEAKGRFAEPTDPNYVLKEGTAENPLGLSQSELTIESGNKEDIPPAAGDQDVIDVLNDLLVGLTTQSGKASNWSDEEVYRYIYAKLLWDGYGNTNSRLEDMGLTGRNGNGDYTWRYDLEKVERLTLDILGRSLPTKKVLNYAYISGDEFAIEPAAGESTEYYVQNYKVRGDELVAEGTIIHYGGYASISGYFEAVVKENPSSIYGYTLVSVEEISGNQDLTNLTATASSVLENSNSYCAPNAVDGNEKTAWVEGVYGDGIGEWIKISTADSSKVEISVIELQLGYHKSYSLWEQNGSPTSVLLEFEDGTEQTADVYYIDAVVLDKPVKTSWVKITILDAKAGSVYSDTCISEIILYGLKT